MPGMNRTAIFIDPAHALSADDISARYVAWMALGGTLKHLPQQLLDLVSDTPVYGLFRNTSHFSPRGTPDMLQLGLELCTDLLPSNENAQVLNLDDSYFKTGHIGWAKQTALIDRAGDAEMWMRLCTIGNRPIVRVPFVTWSAATTSKDVNILGNVSLYWGDGDASGPAYPASAPVMDHRSKIVTGVDNTKNFFPMCIRKPADGSQELAWADAFLQANKVGGPNGVVIPYCPAELFATKDVMDPQTGQTTKVDKFLLSAVPNNGSFEYVDGKKWAARGAINAGMAVFVYVDQIERGQLKVPPAFDQCEALASGTGP
jgi:hypothetical protein